MCHHQPPYTNQPPKAFQRKAFFIGYKVFIMSLIGYRLGYTVMEYTVKTTADFDDWVNGLKDNIAKAKVITTLHRVRKGNFGDHKSVGNGISEIRIHYGKGYRLYYTIQGSVIVFMLTGGDKSTQQSDIRQAQKIKKETT